MKILKLVPKNDKIERDKHLDIIGKSESYILITNDASDGALCYHWSNLSDHQVVSALELVKMSVLEEMK